MPKTKKLDLEYTLLADKVILFPAAVPDPVGSMRHMDDNQDQWYENASEYDHRLKDGITRDDCYISFSSQEEADVVTEVFRTYTDMYGLTWRSVDSEKGFSKEDIQYNGIRYRDGGHLGTHKDQPVDHDIGLVNICLYLNDNYEGGELGFDHIDEIPDFKPKAGDVLVFPGHFDHYGMRAWGGTKYVALVKMYVDGPGVNEVMETKSFDFDMNIPDHITRGMNEGDKSGYGA
jgi:hypothetical protein